MANNELGKETVRPILTYPESLIKPQHYGLPGQILVPSVYVLSSLTAASWVISQFVVKPLSEALSEARHDFSTHVLSLTSEVNGRLSPMVVTQVNKILPSHHSDENPAAADVHASSSDAGGLFQRDFGTQTSPSLSRRASASEDRQLDLSPSDPLTIEQKKLTDLASNLNDIKDGLEDDVMEVLSTELNDLRLYLANLHNVDQARNGYISRLRLHEQSTEFSPITETRAEIRNIKSQLLSAKLFLVHTNTRQSPST